MKTNETVAAPAASSQPGNLSVRQLAKSLIQTPAAGQPKIESPEKPAATREVPAGEREEETLAQTENGEEHTEEAGTEAAAESTAAEAGTETAAGAETEAATETPENTEATVSEAMAQRIDTELAPLIDELTKAGAKGALQILQKRIPKLVDQRDTERNARLAAEQQNGQLRQELAEARQAKGEARPEAGPAGMHPEVARVVTELTNVDHWLGWCEQNPEGGELPDGKDGKLELTAAQVKAMRTTLEHERTELVARKVQTQRDVQAQYQQEYQKHHTAAVAEYPWLTKDNSPEHQEFQAVMKAAPGFKAFPDYELMVADFISGKAMRTAKAKAKANGNGLPRRLPPSREPTRVVAEPPGSSAARKAPEKAREDEADSEFAKSGSTKDLAKRFAATRRAGRSK